MTADFGVSCGHTGYSNIRFEELAQNVQIIEISHAGVGGGAGYDGFRLLGQNGFQIV